VRRVAIALVHYPVLDRQGTPVTSAITNLDVHDIARTALTYGLGAFYVIHPIEAQRQLVERIKAHWISGSGGRRIPDRIAPMKLVHTMTTLDDAVSHFSGGSAAWIWTTSAGALGQASTLSHRQAAAQLLLPGPPVLLLFGTGWGLSKDVHDRATNLLDPIRIDHAGTYNHLSVRAAAAIILDRLLGEATIPVSGLL
jgi:hypothetical protein